MTTNTVPSSTKTLDFAVKRSLAPAMIAGLLAVSAGAAQAEDIVYINETSLNTPASATHPAVLYVKNAGLATWEVEDNLTVINKSMITNTANNKDSVQVEVFDEMALGTSVSLINKALVQNSATIPAAGLHIINGKAAAATPPSVSFGLASASIENDNIVQAKNDAAILITNKVVNATGAAVVAGDISIVNRGRIMASQVGLSIDSTHDSDTTPGGVAGTSNSAVVGPITIKNSASIAAVAPSTTDTAAILVKSVDKNSTTGSPLQTAGAITVEHSAGTISVTGYSGATPTPPAAKGIAVDSTAKSDIKIDATSLSTLTVKGEGGLTGILAKTNYLGSLTGVEQSFGNIVITNTMPIQISEGTSSAYGIHADSYAENVTIANRGAITVEGKSPTSSIVAGIAVENGNTSNSVTISSSGAIKLLGVASKGAGIYVNHGERLVYDSGTSRSAKTAITAAGDVVVDKKVGLPAVYVDPTDNGASLPGVTYNADTLLVIGGYNVSAPETLTTGGSSLLQGGSTGRAVIEVVNNYTATPAGVDYGITDIYNGGEIVPNTLGGKIFQFVDGGSTPASGTRNFSKLQIFNAIGASMSGAVITGTSSTGKSVDIIKNAGTWHLDGSASEFLDKGSSTVYNTTYGKITTIGHAGKLTAQADGVLHVVNDGLIDLSYDNDLGTKLTIGEYSTIPTSSKLAEFTTNGGSKIRLDVVLDNGVSERSDRLIINGGITGSHVLDVNNIGGAGDDTSISNGIILVETTSSNPNAFILQGHSVSAGNYTYTLEFLDGNLLTGSGYDNKYLWVLKSTATQSVPVMGWAGLAGMGAALAALAATRRRKAA